MKKREVKQIALKQPEIYHDSAEDDSEDGAGLFKSLIAPWSFIEWEIPTPPPRLSEVKKLSREE